MNAPVLQTERLTLRAHTVADIDPGLAMWGDPIVTRHIGGIKSVTRADSWQRLLRYAGMWPLTGYGYWAIEEFATGRYVGDVGFGEFKRTIEPTIAGRPEIGWALSPEFHRRGFATECVRAALAWSDAHMPESLTVCIINVANTASIRVAEKTGYRLRVETRFLDVPVLLFERSSGKPEET